MPNGAPATPFPRTPISRSCCSFCQTYWAASGAGAKRPHCPTVSTGSRNFFNLWSAGDLQAADQAIKAAVERWPKQRQIWRTQLAYLLYSGRASEALSILNDTAERPLDVPEGLIDAATATARALTGELSRTEAVAQNLAYLKTDPRPALAVAQACAAMGDAATSLTLLDGYYFGEGAWAALAPRAGDQDRQTSPLFQPPMRSLWNTPAFNRLLNRIGLDDYWHESNSLPDFRRAQ